MNFITSLTSLLNNEDHIYIQTHDYPDHDSVACAFALQELLNHFGITSHLIYEGEIQRDSLKEMIRSLDIPIKHNQKYDLKEHHKIVIVDGCKGNKNVTDLIGDEVALIDHHLVEQPEDVALSDIRPDYGACSTILQKYFLEEDISISKQCATALMIGINMDTSLLTRGVSEADIHAYSWLYPLADINLQNSILRNYIQTRDLDFYRFAIENIQLHEQMAWCYFDQGCNQNLLGILGDFFLALQEVELVVLCAKNGDHINFSIRNENPQWNAAELVKFCLDGIGFGGGHKEMAGGIIKDLKFFDEQLLLKRIIQFME